MQIYHLLNRGTDKRKIFLDDADRHRFMRSLYILNNENPVPINLNRMTPQEKKVFKKERKPLVHIHAFCLMDNHYHLLVSEIIEGGIANLCRN